MRNWETPMVGESGEDFEAREKEFMAEASRRAREVEINKFIGKIRSAESAEEGLYDVPDRRDLETEVQRLHEKKRTDEEFESMRSLWLARWSPVLEKIKFAGTEAEARKVIDSELEKLFQPGIWAQLDEAVKLKKERTHTVERPKSE